MSFSIDNQTLEELNLLGKFRSGSIYSLFNQVRTRGGEQLLDSMFRSPMTDHHAINRRSNIFHFFHELRPSFPFDPQEINTMREYLDTGAASTMLLTLTRTVIRKVLADLTRDERYKKMVQGLQATILTLNKCFRFVEELKASSQTSASFPITASPFADRLHAITAILSDSRIEKLRRIDIYTTLPVKTLAFYDHQLKGSLYQEIEDILKFVYEVDVYTAVSEVAHMRGFTYATAHPAEKNILSAAGLYHPGVRRAVGNAIELDSEKNILFLTGANMAGKSTWMKSVGIATYLAHMGFPIAATQMEFSVREGLYTSINVADNIGLGYSHFYAEVVRVKQAAEATASGKRLLLMFDELFKGTNVKDAYDGTLSVTEAFADYRDCLFIVSTHIIEVGEALAAGHPNIRFVFMPTIMDGAHPRYTYQLREGITEDRQGMMIIRNEGILELME